MIGIPNAAQAPLPPASGPGTGNGADRAGSGREAAPGQNRNTAESADKVTLGNGIQSRYDSPDQVLKNFDPQAVVDNVSSVIERALERAAAQGASQEELASMKEAAQKGIDKGFSDAQDIIKGLGLMSDELGAVIDDARAGINTRLDDFAQGLADLVSTQAAQGVESARFAGASSRQDSFSFSVTTAEGDVVTISAARSQSQSLELIQSQGENARELAATWQDRQGEQFSLMVEGDLSDEEMAAIESLLEEVGQIADKFYSGQYEAAFDKAQRLDLEGDALVSMSLNMTQKTMAVAQYSSMAAMGDEMTGGRAEDWMMPIRQYGQALSDLQRNQGDHWNSKSLIEALNAHPKQKPEQQNFAEVLLGRLDG
ncbi:hypothetical protein E4656_04710 [Natronospirillum operosum]|uniref:DUF5610 domain-containing protein n=1 Tax=Natronospirillum operosum TaxID=2759953 RepID=A0A4Z0WKG4_9GAMM|nr:DUF5610 domain-containing protein [Natronospirillum operosum]TGG95715.1 hypothetical protein E4656_04710 [Natronospirillum operosum]